jgi:hypothetical protein
MSTYPYPYLSQLEDGSGRNNCFEAALGAYLLAAGKLTASLGQHAILNAVSEATRGTPDSPHNPETDLPEAAKGLEAYGLPADWTNSYDAAMAAPWAICLVDGVVITKADGTKPYPASWFGGMTGPDHFIVWGPQFDGAGNWFMNPLDPAGVWAQYDLVSIQAAWGGAYLLPAVTLRQYVTTQRVGLKRAPSHTSPLAIGPDHQGVTLAAGAVVVPTGQTDGEWTRITVPGGPIWGWLLAANVAEK